MDQLSQSVTLAVGYYDPFQVFSTILGEKFKKQTNLNSLYWKYKPADSIRTIKNVQLRYIEDDLANKVTNINEEDVFMKFIFVTTTSVDEYRSKVRPIIRQWLNNLKSMNPRVTYCIILYENISLRSAADKFLKTSILTKIRNDFADPEMTLQNSFKIKSSYSDPDAEREIWNGLVSMIKLGIMESISAKMDYFHTLRPKLLGVRKSADLFLKIGQFVDSAEFYSRILQSVGNINKEDGFERVDFQDLPLRSMISNVQSSTYMTTKYEIKAYAYERLSQILMNDSVKTIGLYMRNSLKLADFLLSFLNSIYDCNKKSEFCILLIEDFFSDKKLRFILDKNEEVPNQLYEVLGDLKFLEKDELTNLGNSKNYKMKGCLSDISFTSSSGEIMHPYKVISIKIEKFIKTEKLFKQHVVEITEECIKLYSQSPYKQNTVDTLSTEVALMLYYSMNDYETSVEVISNSFQFYKSSGWNSVSLALLKVYVDNLSKLRKKVDHSIVADLLVSYLEMISMNQENMLDQFRNLVSDISEPLIIENDNIIDISINPEIECVSPDIYAISVHFDSKLSDIKADSIVLSLTSQDDAPCQNEDHYLSSLEFSTTDFMLKTKFSCILKSKKIIVGEYFATKITIHIGKLCLVKHIFKSVKMFQIYSLIKSDRIFSNTMIDISVPKTRYLNKDQVLLVVHVGDNPFNKFEFILNQFDESRLISHADYILSVIQFKDNSRTRLNLEFGIENLGGALAFKYSGDKIMNKGDEILLYIPYMFPPDVSNTKVLVGCNFIFGDGYSKYCSKSLETSLSIAVSVQDIFKSSNLFSNYTINSVMVDNPVRVQRVSLDSPKNDYQTKIDTWHSPKNVIAYIDQGSTFFYRLTNLKDESLNLSIEYNDLHSEIVEIFKSLYYEKLEASKPYLLRYFNVLSEEIFDKLDFKHNLYGLTGRVELVNYDLSKFSKAFKLINTTDLSVIIQSIAELVHDLNSQTFKVNDEILGDIQHRLIISVPLPVINIINIVELDFRKKLQYLVCQPIEVTLRLRVIILQKPNNSEKKVRFQTSSTPRKIKLQLNFAEHEQLWLIAGEQNFTKEISLDIAHKPKNVLETELTLIPLRIGRLELPRIEVHNLTNFNIEMELDYKNSSETVLVVSELNKVVHTF